VMGKLVPFPHPKRCPLCEQTIVEIPVIEIQERDGSWMPHLMIYHDDDTTASTLLDAMQKGNPTEQFRLSRYRRI
jgi:hypothetical protein